jgi:hypothetical protein
VFAPEDVSQIKNEVQDYEIKWLGGQGGNDTGTPRRIFKILQNNECTPRNLGKSLSYPVKLTQFLHSNL